MICIACQGPISGRFTRLKSGDFHPDCIRCASCKRRITDTYHPEGRSLYHPECHQKKAGLVCQSCRKVLGEKWVVYEKKNYHGDCLEKIVVEKCDHCGKGLVGRYLVDPWGQKVHPGHHLAACDSCHRYLLNQRERYSYVDGRSQCPGCHKMAVKSAGDLKKIEKQVRAHLEEMGISGLPPGVPISMLDLSRMKRVSRAHADNPKGLTKTQIHRVKGVRSFSHEVFVLYGLPLVEFKGVLAHELMHVWLHEKGIRLKHAQTEGLCNLASFFVYSKDGSELASYLLKAMMKNPDPVYGQGYRSMLHQVRSLGWKNFLEQLTTHKDLNRSLWKKIFG